MELQISQGFVLCPEDLSEDLSVIFVPTGNHVIYDYKREWIYVPYMCKELFSQNTVAFLVKK